MAFGGNLWGTTPKTTAKDALSNWFAKQGQKQMAAYGPQTDDPTKGVGATGVFSGNGLVPGQGYINATQDYITSSAAANYLSAMSARDAMEFSKNEAAALREWQQGMWQQTSAYNASEAQKNRDWQERMSNTAYQRAMADMRAAGLNPILAYTQGGASTPGGSSASMGTMSGAMGTGYSYQGLQESSGLLKLVDFVGTTAKDIMNNFNESVTESKGLRNWIRTLLNPKKKGWS